MKKILVIVAVLALSFSGNILNAADKIQKISILHTNDMHSQFLGMSPNRDYTPFVTGDDNTLGGWSRVGATLDNLRSIRETNGIPVLTLDAGDFTMGTLFSMVITSESAELMLMKNMGYDAVCLGNHEFDFGPEGLADILTASKKSQQYPPLLMANIAFSQQNSADDRLEAIFKSGMVKPYIIVEKNGLKIGIFGLMGENAAFVSPNAKPVTFTDRATKSAEIVKLLKQEKVDLIVCVSHGGLTETGKKSEEEMLAKAVPDIDVIVSGHTHTRIDKSIEVGKTIILQAWCYGMEVGVLDLTLKNGKVDSHEYRTVIIDDTIKGDARLDGLINSTIYKINRQVLAPYGFSFNQDLASSKYDLIYGDGFSESNLGNIIADSIIWSANRSLPSGTKSSDKIVGAIEGNGLIRSDILCGKKSKFAVCDIVNSYPLGYGKDHKTGYSILSAYFYGSEIKQLLEITTSIPRLEGEEYFLQIAGMKVTYNPNRCLLDRVTGIWLGNARDGYIKVDYSRRNKTLYRLAGNSYNMAMLGGLNKMTGNLLSVIPKNSDGTPMKDLYTEGLMDADPLKPGVQELKEWVGLLQYIQNLPDLNGDRLADIPDYYAGRDNRIVAEPSWNPFKLLHNAGKFTWIPVGVVVMFLGILGYMVRKIIRWLYCR